MAKKEDKNIPKFDDTEPVFEDTQALSPEDQDVLSKYMSKPEVPMMESARAGLANGGTYGFAPRLGAAGGALASAAQQKLSGEPSPQSLPELYNEYLKYNNERQAKAKEGNPITYGGTQLLGGIASPLNKIGALGAAAKGASIPTQMIRGIPGGMAMGTIGGLSQSPDLGNLKEDVTNAGIGAALGAPAGALAPAVSWTLGKAASGAASAVRPLIGKPGTMFSKGLEAGIEGGPNLAGEPGQLQATEQRNQFAHQFVQDVHQVLTSNAKNKRELISQALSKSQLAPAEAVQAIQQKYLEANPHLNEESARKELEQLKEMFITAAEGPKTTKTVRTYHNAENQPAPAPSTPNIPLGQVERGTMVPPGEMPPGAPMPPQGQPQLGPGGQNAVVPSEGGITGEASRMQPPPPETPAGFEGYEAVHKATITKGDEEARAAFEHKIHEKLADEEALGLNHNDNPIQIEEKEIPGSDKVRLVAKRAKVAEEPNDFKEQAQALTQRQKEQQRLQDLLDRQQQEADKMRSQQDAEMVKPQYTDETIETRQGGRNLQNPEELYALQKNLQAKSQFSEGRGFSSQEMNKMSGDAAKDVAQLIKLTVPETIPVDQRLTAFNNVAESLGINTDNLSLPGGEGQKARQDAMKKILSVLNPEDITDKSQLGQKTINYVQQQLSKVHPDIGEAFGQEAAKHAENAGTISELVKPETVGGGGPILSSIRRGLNKTAYGLGHGAGEQINKIKSEYGPSASTVKQTFQQYTPEALQKAAAGAAQSTNKATQQLGQVLSKLATADDRTRNSMLFILQQQDGYRELMAPYFSNEEPGTPQAKDKHVEKYK